MSKVIEVTQKPIIEYSIIDKVAQDVHGTKYSFALLMVEMYLR